ncbi:putative ribonuclease H-like domain-containing protein, partial [Tanacetum coccineum]
MDKKVKIIRSDNGTKFKNKVMDEFCREKGIKREYNVARTPQQNGIAERTNRTLIEAARTMLADSKLPSTFWAEAVSTACYVQNRVLIVKPHNKTPYELFRGIKPARGFMKPFGCHVTILNTLDKLGKFDGKSDEVVAGTFSNDFAVHAISRRDASSLDELSPRIVARCSNTRSQMGYMRRLIIQKKDFDDSSLRIWEGRTTRVWILVDLPKGHRAIGTKWYQNKKDGKGGICHQIQKLRLLLDWTYQEEGIYYDEVFVLVARIEAIRILLAYASYMGFMVYQIDVKSAFLYGQIEGGSESASTPADLEKPLVQDGDANDVDEHLYRSMIGSLMYLTASRPDIMFAVCACARFQVSPKTSHLLAVKRIFRYLKGKPSLGLWYSKDSPLELVAYTDSDYAGATQDRKSTTRGCQFLGNRLISWQCKKQTVVATSTTEAEYMAACEIGYSMMHYLRGGMLFVLEVLVLIPHNNWSCFYNEALASPEQTATGKDFSNPLIVD